MKKVILFINLTFLTVLAFLSAGILVTKQSVYAGTLVSSVAPPEQAFICGSLASSSVNIESLQADNDAAMRGSNDGTGCLHQSGLGLFCMITRDKRRHTTKC